MAVEYEDLSVKERRQSSCLWRRKNDHDQLSPECGQSNLKQYAKKLGWKNAERQAENRRKRWAQADPILDYWKAVSASRCAAPFRRPVSLVEDYNTVIRQPIDLSTIRRQLESDENYSISFLRRDLTLMVTNALIYFKKGTEMHEMGLKLKNHAMKLFEGRHKGPSYPYPKLSRSGNSTKCTKIKHVMRPILELPDGSSGVPLALLKRHRTSRRPRLCIPNVIRGLRGDVSTGVVMDSSSEEEAAAVLICFSSGQSGDVTRTLATSKSAKLESPRKNLRSVGMETANMSSCSGTRHEGLCCHLEEVIGHPEFRIRSAGPLPARSISTVDKKFPAAVSKKRGCTTAREASQMQVSEKPELSSDTFMPLKVEAVGVRSLKHKWQERWRIQSASSFETSGSLEQSSEQYVGQSRSQKSTTTGDSPAGTKYRSFLQVVTVREIVHDWFI